MNAIGFVKSPEGFCDITDEKMLSKIGIHNILGGSGVNDKRQPKPGYKKLFPRVVHHFETNKPFLDKVIEYHDVSKHRSSVITGGDSEGLRLTDSPKQAGSGMSSTVHTLESLAYEFQTFVDELLPIAFEETTATFGYEAIKHSVR